MALFKFSSKDLLGVLRRETKSKQKKSHRVCAWRYAQTHIHVESFVAPYAKPMGPIALFGAF